MAIYRFLFLFMTCYLLCILAFSQNKIENEKSIKKSEVPQVALDWLDDAFENIKKPKWYQEFFENGYSYEAKFRYQHHFYSVEFDSLGRIEDVEVEIKISSLANEIRESIETYWHTNYEKYKVLKAQVQYSGEDDDLEDFFDENSSEGVRIAYEIEYQGKERNGADELWEATFDSSGAFISKRKIIIRISDNLTF